MKTGYVLGELGLDYIKAAAEKYIDRDDIRIAYSTPHYDTYTKSVLVQAWIAIPYLPGDEDGGDTTEDKEH